MQTQPSQSVETSRVRGSASARVSANVTRRIAELDRTQSWLARRLGVSQMWVARRLLGRALWTVEDLVEAAEVLGCTPEALLAAPPAPAEADGEPERTAASA